MSSRATLRRSTRAVAIEGLEDRKLFAAYRAVDLAPDSGTALHFGAGLDVSENGVIVGNYDNNAAYWTPKSDGTYARTDLGFGGEVSDIDSSGSYMIAKKTGDSDSYFYANGKKVAIDDPSTASSTDGLVLQHAAVNASGNAVGVITNFDSPDEVTPTTLVMVDSKGKVSPLPFGELSGSVSVTAINDKGQIYGGQYLNDGTEKAFVYTNGTFRFIRPLDGATEKNSVATKNLNAAGAVIAVTGGNTSAPVSYTDTPQAGATSKQVAFVRGVQASGLNDRGDIVGGNQVQFSGSPAVSLSTLADSPSPLDLSNSGMFAINNNRVMVGYGVVNGPRELREKPYVLIPVTTPTGFTLRGQLFNDNNGNGKKDANDAATGARTVFLDTDGDGTLDTGETSTTSDANGNYAFPGLAAGAYKVSRVFPKGYELSNGGGNRYVTATITNADVAYVDIGTRTATPVALGTITGPLFDDSNKNGKFDASEKPTGVRTVFLDTNGNKKLDAGERSTTSGKNGVYAFTGLAAGTYRVSRVFPAGFKLSNNAAGYLTISVASGTTVNGVNLGTRPV